MRKHIRLSHYFFLHIMIISKLKLKHKAKNNNSKYKLFGHSPVLCTESEITSFNNLNLKIENGY